jgi:hypothetical protein
MPRPAHSAAEAQGRNVCLVQQKAVQLLASAPWVTAGQLCTILVVGEDQQASIGGFEYDQRPMAALGLRLCGRL